jgi:hypothetical protein
MNEQALSAQELLDATDRAYAALRADPEAWAAELAERALWDATLLDGLDISERWDDPAAENAAARRARRVR